jgi:hypothetical protein
LEAVNIYALDLARLPNVSLKILQRLAKTLRRDTPDSSNAVVEAAAADLDEHIATVDAALAERVVAENPQVEVSEIEFDHAVDRLWIALRRILEEKQTYLLPGLGALPPKRAQECDLPARREEGTKARKLWERLFAAEGTKFTRSGFILQAETMAALLRMLEREQLRAELEAVVGADLVRTIEACQIHYEDVVSDRLSRQSGYAHDFRELRNQLRWGLVAYVQAVHSLYSPKQPKSEALVLDALRAVINLRDQISQAGGEVELDELLEDLVELELPEAESEAEAKADPEAEAEADPEAESA